MSFCRWSSDDFQCDVYVYEADYGFVIHVANNKVIFQTPLPAVVEYDPDNFQPWFERHAKVSEMVRDADKEPITLPHAGETFTLDTANECADKLEYLSSLGYNVPSYAISSLREEPEN